MEESHKYSESESVSRSVVSDSVTPWTVACQGSSVLGILQARILEHITSPFSKGSSWPRDQTHVSCVSCIGRQILYRWVTGEAHADIISKYKKKILLCNNISQSTYPSPKYFTVEVICRHHLNQMINENVISSRTFQNCMSLKGCIGKNTVSHLWYPCQRCIT